MYVSALRRLGYHCSLSHVKAGLLKTDAPPEVVWDFVRAHYFAEGKKMPTDNPKAAAILGGPSTVEISLEIDDDVKEELRLDKARCKYYENPTKNYGPKAAAKAKKHR
jgi:tRNA (guanine26-N2/guanine27-N2)-dimethyltransferase